MEKRPIELEVIGRKIILRMPKNDNDVRFVRTLQYVRWNKENYFWEIPHYPGNLERIQQYFGERISKLSMHEEFSVNVGSQEHRINKNQVLVIKTSSRRLRLIFGFHSGLMKVIKTIPYYKWDTKNKWWTIPYSEQFLEEIKKVISRLGLELLYEPEFDFNIWQFG